MMDRFSKFMKNHRIKYVSRLISKTETFKVADQDDDHILVDAGQDIQLMVLLNTDQTLKLETVLTFDGDLLNLKTFSDIANIFYSQGIATTGISPQNAGKIKFYVGKSIRYTSANKELVVTMEDIRNSIMLVSRYIKLREKQTKEPMLDLTMFAEINTDGFNPKELGEKKDFIFGSWLSFYAAVARSYEDGDLTSADANAMIKELKACEDFEVKNNMYLSEIGDMVWQEINWNRELQETHDNKNCIN